MLKYNIDTLFDKNSPYFNGALEFESTPSFQAVDGLFQSGKFNGGQANLQDVKIGGTTTQYKVGDKGIFSFGDGSDGALTTSGNVTLTADMYYTTLIVSTGDTITTDGYRIFCSQTLVLEGTGKIVYNGVAGGNGGVGGDDSGAVGAAGTAGTALADGYLKGAGAGKAGGAGGQGQQSGACSAGSNGTDGVAVSAASIGSNGVAGATGGAGGNGGNGGGCAAGTAGTAGTRTDSLVKLIANWHLSTLLDVTATGATLKFDNSAGTGSGSGGGGGAASGGGGVGFRGGSGGGGGGSGSAGGIVGIYAQSITIGANASITANGGAGGNGGNGGAGGTSGNTGGGGGGGAGSGGNGGQLILVYNSIVKEGTTTATGGAAGTGGTGGTASGTGVNGSNGSAGTVGTAGSVREFDLSL